MSKSVKDTLQTSRSIIENRLFQEVQAILNTQNAKLDSKQSAFSTFILRALAQQISNALLFGTVVHRESSLVTALLPETIRNWAKYIAYTPSKAIPAKTMVLLQIPLVGQFETIVQKGFKFYAIGNIPFKNDFETKIKFLNNAVEVSYTDDTGPVPLVKTLPYTIVQNGNIPVLNIDLSCTQTDVEELQFQISNLLSHEFYQYNFRISDKNQFITNVVVSDDMVPSYKITSNIFASDATDYVVQMESYKDSGILIFGNGIYGKQPNQNTPIKVTVTTTFGSGGNVLAGTITSGDTLYTSNLPTPKVVEYTVTNVNDVRNGKDEESIDETKRNAPIALSSLNRLVSNSDFENSDIILNRKEIVKSIPILKRSDLVTNEINLYSVFKFKNQVVKASTIAIDTPVNSTIVKQFSKFTDSNNITWISLLGLEVNSDLKIAKYTYIPNQLVIGLSLVSSQGIPISSTDLSVNFNPTDYTFNLFITTISQSTVSQTIRIYNKYTSNDFTPEAVNTVQSYSTFLYTVDADVFLSGTEIEVFNSVNGEIAQVYSAKLDIAYKYNDLTFSYLSDDKTKILDVPVVLDDYYQSLSTNDKYQLQDMIITDFIYKSNSKNVRLMNSNVAPKFAKTYGKLENIQYSEPAYYVEKIVNSLSDVQHDKKYYAISDPVTDPTISQYAGYLVIWDGIKFQYIQAGTGTIIENNTDHKIYVTDGRRWMLPDYTVPLNIEIEVYSDRTDSGLTTDVETAILNYVNSLQIEESVFLSKIIEVTQNIDGVKYCRILHPRTDIIYRNILKNISKQDFTSYTPEYIYTDSEHIKIRVNRGQ